MSTTSHDVYPKWTVDYRNVKLKSKNRTKEMAQLFVIHLDCLRKSETKQIQSPDLRLKHLDNTVWYMTVEPKVRQLEENGSHDDYLSVFLHLKTRNVEHLFGGQIARFEVTVMNTKTNKMHSKLSENLYFTSMCGWGWKCFIKRDQLIGSTSRTLDIHFQITVTLIQLRDVSEFCDNTELDISCCGDSAGDHKIDIFSFNHDFINDREFCDITCRFDDNFFMRVHSKVLSSKSPVLRVMCNKQTDIEIVKTDGMTDIVFYEFIAFLYNNYSPNILTYCRPLLIAADYYRIPHMKYMCDQLCYRRMTADEAIDALDFAIKYNTISTLIRVMCYTAVNLERVVNAEPDKWKRFVADNRDVADKLRQILQMKCQCC